MQNTNPNPLTDKKTLLAIVLAGLFMFGWQAYMNKMYPQSAKVAAPPTATPANDTSVVAEQPVAASGSATPGTSEMKTEQFLSYENDRTRFTVSSRGMGIKELIIKEYKDSEGQPIRLGFSPESGLFEARRTKNNIPYDFEMRELAPGDFEGTAKEGTTEYVRRLTFNPQKGSFDSSLTVKNPPADIGTGISFWVPETIRHGKSSWLFPSYDHQDFFVSHGGNTDTLNINHSKENVSKSYPSASIVSVGTQYFTSALLDRSDIAPEAVLAIDLTKQSSVAELVYKPVQNSGTIVLNQIFYAGPKSIDVLKNIDPAMAHVIDFGYLAVIARPLLYVMKWFHSLIPNWGLAIILLTLLVRFVVLPFNLMSVKSMRAMQKIQPAINQLRERHKEDPMTMNKEMMALMKENKANPLGGCLPMLIQIPIFFALYRVIGSSVELYQSPFVGWINDLSAPDRFFVLPVLMGISMFAQQKMTPSAMDPAQAKIMAFMPLIFSVFMLQLPSGLTLYMVVSALFGVTQQYFILKGAPAPVSIPVETGRKKK